MERCYAMSVLVVGLSVALFQNHIDCTEVLYSFVNIIFFILKVVKGGRTKARTIGAISNITAGQFQKLSIAKMH